MANISRLFRLLAVVRPLPGSREGTQSVGNECFVGAALPTEMCYKPSFLVLDHLDHPGVRPAGCKRFVIDPCDGAATKVRLEHLAHSGFWDFVYDFNMLRNRGALVNVLGGIIQKLFFGDGRARHQFDISTWQFPGMRVRLANRARHCDGGVTRQGLFDLGRVDIVPAADDQVFGAARYPEVPVGVDPPQVTCSEEAVVVEQIGILIILCVSSSGEDARIRYADFADLIRFTFPNAVVRSRQDFHVRIGKRNAD